MRYKDTNLILRVDAERKQFQRDMESMMLDACF